MRNINKSGLRVRMDTTIRKESDEGLIEIARRLNLKFSGRWSKGRAIDYLVEKELQHDSD